MSPLRRHGGGRPRSAHSMLDVAEQWGISHKAARRLAARKLNDDAMAVLVCDIKQRLLRNAVKSLPRADTPVA